MGKLWKRLSGASPAKASSASQQQQAMAHPLSADLSATAERAAAAAASAQATSAALFKAAEDGDEASVDTAIAAGAQVNCEDKIGRTPLLYAARGGRLRVCQHLVRLGADVLSSDRDGRNALHYSARRGHTDVARWFIGQGLSVARTDVHALTPLHQATLGKNAAMVDMLLRAGSDLHARDANGCTPFKLAKRFEHDASESGKAVVECLLAWDAALRAQQEIARETAAAEQARKDGGAGGGIAVEVVLSGRLGTASSPQLPSNAPQSTSARSASGGTSRRSILDPAVPVATAGVMSPAAAASRLPSLSTSTPDPSKS